MTYGPEITRGSLAWPAGDVRPRWLGDDDLIVCNGPRKASSNLWAAATSFRLPAEDPRNQIIADGFVPWSGGDEAPAGVKDCEVLFRDGSHGAADGDAEYFRWPHWNNDDDIIAYRPKVASSAAGEEERGSIEHEIRRQCEIGAGSAARTEEGLLSVNADLDIREIERVAAARPAPNTVTLQRMSEDEARTLSAKLDNGDPGSWQFDVVVKVLRHLDLIATPATPLDQWFEKHGDGLSQEARAELVRIAGEEG